MQGPISLKLSLKRRYLTDNFMKESFFFLSNATEIRRRFVHQITHSHSGPIQGSHFFSIMKFLDFSLSLDTADISQFQKNIQMTSFIAKVENVINIVMVKVAYSGYRYTLSLLPYT